MASVSDRAGFRLSVISILVLLVAIALRGWVFFSLVRVFPKGTGIRIDSIGNQIVFFLSWVVIGAIAVPFVLSWLSWLIFRRSQVVATVVFCVVTIVVTLATADRSWRIRAGVEQIDKAQARLFADMRASMGDPVSSSSSVQQLNSFVDTMGKATSGMAGREKKAGEAMQRFFRLLTLKMQAYAAATQALAAAGFSRAKGIRTREDLQHRRELVRNFGKANKDVEDFYRNAEGILRHDLEEENLPRTYIDPVLVDFRKTTLMVLKVRACDDELVTQSNKILDLYDREWATWRVEESGKVIFVNPAAVDEFVAAQQSILEIAGRQQKLQKQVLDNAAAAKGSAH